MTLGEKTLDNNQLTPQGNQTVPGPESSPYQILEPAPNKSTSTWSWYGLDIDLVRSKTYTCMCKRALFFSKTLS